MLKRLNKIIKKVAACTCNAVADKRAEGFIDSGVKILIAVVIGALILGALYVLFNSTIIPQMFQKMTEIFRYGG